MPGQYTELELTEMSAEEFAAAKARGWLRPDPSDRPDYAGVAVGSSVPGAVQAPEPSRDVWRNNKTADGGDFTCPSGQTCRLRRLQPEQLLAAGILDRVTRLEGLADALVNSAEGQPPTKESMPSTEDFKLLLDTVDKLVPLAVAEPRVWEEGDEDAPEDAIFVGDIDLMDRIAIMERSLRGIKLLDKFRNAR